MKKRYLYTIIFGVLGLFVGVLSAGYAYIMLAGIFQFYTFGDSYSPDWQDSFVLLVAILTYVSTVVASIIAGYQLGKRAEQQNAKFNLWYVLIIIILLGTYLLFSFLKSKQDNQDIALCRELCIQHGYDGKGMAFGPEENGKIPCACWNEEKQQSEDVGFITLE